MTVAVWALSLLMLFEHLDLRLESSSTPEHRSMAEKRQDRLGWKLRQVSKNPNLADTYHPKTYPPATFASPWNKTDGFLPLQGGKSGRTLIMSPWKDVDDLQEKRVSLAPFGTRESGVLTCEDGTQIIVGGYNIDYKRMRGVLQIFPKAGRRPNPQTTNPWYVVDLPTDIGQSHQGATCHNMEVYIVSGQHGIGCGPSTTRAAKYNIADNTWQYLPDLPAGRYIPGVAIIDNVLHAFRGASENRYVGATNHWTLDLHNMDQGWQEIDPLPASDAGGHPWVFKRTDNKAVYIGGAMWGDAPMVEGNHDIYTDCHDKPNGYIDQRIFRLDPATGKWTQNKHDFPMDASHILQTTIPTENVGIAMGGAAKSGTVETESNSWFFEEATSEWSLGMPMPRKIKGQTVIIDYTGRVSVAFPRWVEPKVEASKEVAEITKLYTTRLTVAEPLQAFGTYARMQVMRPVTVGLGENVNGQLLDRHFTTDLVTPVVLNLASRPDRLFLSIEEMNKMQWHCFVRFDALAPSVEMAKDVGIIGYENLHHNFTVQKKHNWWWKSWVDIDFDSYFAAHVGVKLSMVEFFRAAAAEPRTLQLENMLSQAGCQRRSSESSAAQSQKSRPILIIEDDSLFVKLDEIILQRALDDLASVPKWHLLYISFRDEKDFPKDQDPPGVTEVRRVQRVLGNTAMLVNPDTAHELVDIFGAKTDLGLESTLDHLMRVSLERQDVWVYRLKKRMVVPILSKSSIHGTAIEYSDTQAQDDESSEDSKDKHSQRSSSLSLKERRAAKAQDH